MVASCLREGTDLICVLMHLGIQILCHLSEIWFLVFKKGDIVSAKTLDVKTIMLAFVHR